jgi:gliding motility-associated-like protein
MKHDFLKNGLGRSFWLLFMLLCSSATLHATHNRAGEIHVRQTGPLSVEATIITYTKASSNLADRDSLQICWGDGDCETVYRVNGQGESLGDDIKMNLYVGQHTYSGKSTYVISMTDPNRNGGILNVNQTSSDAVPFHIQTTYTFLNAQFQGINTTPYLNQRPIDRACIGQPFKHNPNAYDPDGDSLAYFLIVPMMEVYTQVPLYQYPQLIGANPLDLFSLDEVTGDLLWDAPEIAGEYNVALIVVSYRDGAAIDTTVRDMQIFVLACNNEPPVIEAPNEICVVAGDTVQFNVTATDTDADQLIVFEATGEPLLSIYSPATFTGPTSYTPSPIAGTFTWVTTCEHISEQFYNVVFKVSDNYFDSTGLSDLKLVRIKVVGPPPKEVDAVSATGTVTVSWAKPYVCEDPADNSFFRFGVWRRINSNPFEPDTCAPGLDGQGYTRVGYWPDYPIIADRYQFLDTSVERGRTYCYRILADFASLTSTGNPYNIFSSLASEEVCLQLSKDIPLMLEVDIAATSTTGGIINTSWTKPDATDLDTMQNLPPYEYILSRSDGGAFVPVATFSSLTFEGANDTTFIDTGLNTSDLVYNYKVALRVNNEPEPFGDSEKASSVRLSIASTDEKNILSWTYQTPWTNQETEIFRLDGGVWLPIGQTSEEFYTDNNLINGQNYCYYVRTIGSYGIIGVPDPLLNRSQEACGVPLDTIPPCVPVFAVYNPCETATPDTPIDSFVNTIIWANPNLACPQTDDLLGYKVYFSPDTSSTFSVIADIPDIETTSFQFVSDLGLAGCFTVSAYDSLGNESLTGSPICLKNCPIYTLPNTFTPNGDGANDLFIPYPYRFISEVDFQVRNIWGVVVYETQDPDLGWDGNNQQGVAVATSTYQYFCRVWPTAPAGQLVEPFELVGFIELVR